jgi:hypothetical protein
MIESTRRLVNKLTVQYEAFRGIVAKIYRVRSYVKEFSKVSELVLDYLEKSRDLWDVGNHNENGGSRNDVEVGGEK